MSPDPLRMPMDRKNVEDLYPLSPTQQALLFHSLQAGGADPGFLQLRGTLCGLRDAGPYVRAWSEVIERHSALRTSVHWLDLERPLQAVFRTVTLSRTEEDWRGVEEAERQGRLERYLHDDRARGLDLSQAPVMRLALFRLEEDRWHFVWSCHHVLLDGWSGALVLEEVSVRYAALQEGRTAVLPPARPYREYVAWLQRQDSRAAEEFWRGALAGVRASTPLPFDGAPGPGGGRGRLERTDAVKLDRPTTAALEQVARRYRLTLGTLVQGGWALLLGVHGGEEEVTFGATVSGRTADVPGIESMVGLFINTLPVRVRLDGEAPLHALLAAMQERQVAATPYEQTPLHQLQAWSGLPGDRRLFESLLVVENFPWTLAEPTTGGGLRIEGFSGDITTGYPLTVVALPGERLSLQLLYDGGRFAAGDAARIVGDLGRLLAQIARDPEQRVGELLAAAGSELRAGVSPRREAAPRAAPRAAPPAAGRARSAGPRDALEHQLVQIWEEVLGVHPVRVADDFFALGGHSLHAAQLFDEIERRLGRRLPLATLLQHATVERLAGALRDAGSVPSWSSLVPIQPEGTRPPLFCIHSWNGDVLMYLGLAHHLGPDQPVYGLQAVGLDGTTPPLGRVEEMAAHYLREMRSVQPSGPYALLGRCFGGSVALEMAHQLQAAGERVAALILLDNALKNPLPPGVRRVRTVRMVCDQAYGLLVRRPVRLGREALIRRFGTPRQKQARRLADAILSAWQRHEPPVFDGPITLIRSSQFAAKTENEWAWHLARWSELATGGLSTCVVPGKHTTLMKEPHVREVADRLRRCLDDAFAPVPQAAEAPTLRSHAAVSPAVNARA